MVEEEALGGNWRQEARSSWEGAEHLEDRRWEVYISSREVLFWFLGLAKNYDDIYILAMRYLTDRGG